MKRSEPVVFVVDDDEAVRDSLSMLMRSVGLAVETYPSALEFLDRFDASRTGCLVLDVRMPGMSGIELQERLAAKKATLPIIFVTGHGDVPMAVQALRTGAVDFIQKPFSDQALLDRIQQALAQHVREQEEASRKSTIRERIARLTPREKEVMQMVADGKANKVIAADLGVSERTVEIHRARVMEKMLASSLPDLVKMVLKSCE
jgi:FixJ family two-component response regulator